MNYLKIILCIIEILLFGLFCKYFGPYALVSCIGIILFIFFKEGVEGI